MIGLSKKDDAGSDEDPFDSESESDMDTEELDEKIIAHQKIGHEDHESHQGEQTGPAHDHCKDIQLQEEVQEVTKRRCCCFKRKETVTNVVVAKDVD